MPTAGQIPFSPLGNTFVIAADAVAPAGVQITTNTATTAAPGYADQYRVVNAGAATVFLGIGTDATTATAAAVAAAAGVPAAGVPMLAGAVEILRFPPGSFISGKAASPATVYITPGQGL